MSISLEIPTAQDEFMGRENICESIIITIPNKGSIFTGESKDIVCIRSNEDSTKQEDLFFVYLEKKDVITMAKRILAVYDIIENNL